MSGALATTPTGDALQLLEPFLADASNDLSRDDPRWDLIGMALDALPAPSDPPNLVGRPCQMAPGRWHLEALLTGAGQAPDKVMLAKRAYHTRWLARLLAPTDARFAPLVSVVIPVYNRAEMVAEAVESCLRQNHRPLEIIVVDDGSTDDLRATLERFGERIRLHRQANAGVSKARNAGIRRATGDFVHFLDSDNTLHPEAVRAKVGAFYRIPDAGLCFSDYEQVDTDSEAWVRPLGHARPSGELRCGTTSLLNLSAARRVFLTSTVMLPRWLLLETGGFDASLPRGEDTRYWFVLGTRDVKAIAINRPLMLRRRPPGALSFAPEDPPVVNSIIALRNLLDTLRDTRHWSYAGSFACNLAKERRWSWLATQDDERVLVWKQRLLETIGRLGDGRARGGLSPLPLLFSFHQAIYKTMELGWKPPDDRRSFHHRLLATLETAIAGAAPLRPKDVGFWYTQPFQESIDRPTAILFNRVRCHARGPTRKQLDQLLRDLSRDNSLVGIRLYRALRSEVGHPKAVTLMRHVMPFARTRDDIPALATQTEVPADHAR